MEPKYIKAQVEKQDDGKLQLVVFSDDSVDRMGDTIDPKGWDLTNFKKNNVLLWAHDSGLGNSIPAIGKVTNAHIDAKGRLVGGMEFDMEDEFAQKVYKKYLNGILKATSVGFKPLEFTETDKGYNFLKQELLEISCVNVPANPKALVELRSMKGKGNKTKAALMEEYLEKNELLNGKKRTKKTKKTDKDENSTSDRLDEAVNELKNVANTLGAISEQLRKAVASIPATKSKGELTDEEVMALLKDHPSFGALMKLVEVYRLADKSGETFLKLAKEITHTTKKPSGEGKEEKGV